MDTSQTDTAADTEQDQFTETRKKRTMKKRKLADSPEILATGTRNDPILVDMDPLPNPLALAKKLKENFGEGITQTKPFRNGKGVLIFTKGNQSRKELTTKNLNSLFPGTKIRVRDTAKDKEPTRTTEGHFIIKGVDIGLTKEDIEEELRSQGLRIIRINRINSLKFDSPTRLIRVITEAQETAEKAIKFGILLGLQRHKCEKPHNSEVVKTQQCYNCQTFGHIATACTKKTVCQRCGGEHTIRECEKTKDEARCPNCQDNHPASYRGCPVQKKQEQEQRKLYSEAVNNRKPPTKEEVRKTIEENSIKTETDLQLIKARFENNHKQALEEMEKHLKKMEEGVYVFVASLTLLIKNLVGEQKKPEAVRTLNQVAELAKKAFGKEFSPNLQEYKRK